MFGDVRPGAGRDAGKQLQVRTAMSSPACLSRENTSRGLGVLKIKGEGRFKHGAAFIQGKFPCMQVK